MDPQGDTSSSVVLDRFRGALAFSAVGDALGWPTEFVRYPKQAETRFGRKCLENYVRWEKMVGGRFWGYKEIIGEGEYSDDTQLSLAVYRCIDETGDFSPDRFAYFELPLWLHYQRGGGRSIKGSAKRLNQSSRRWENNFYETKDLSYRNAGANGAAMRVLPIALTNFDTEEKLFRNAFLNAIVTHGHPRAILGTIIYASAVNFLMREKVSNQNLINYLDDTINSFSKTFKDDDFIQEWVQRWDKKPLDGMRFREVFHSARNEAIDYLGSIESRLTSNNKEFYKLTGALTKAYKGSGISTVLVAIYLFLKYVDGPKKAIFSAVNMLGSDTDSIAAFVGGLFGAHYGLSAVPANLLDGLQDREYILKAATHLYNISTGAVVEKYVSSKTFDRYDAYLKIMAWEIGLHEMFWDALAEGNTIVHPALGQGRIRSKRVEPLAREDYHVKLIEIHFECGQTCVFHSRVSKSGQLSASLAEETKKTLDSMDREKDKAATRMFRTTMTPFQRISATYGIPAGHRKAIERFVSKHQYLYPELEKASEQITSVFGKNAVEISLELHADRQEDWEGLFIVVKTNLPPGDSLDLLDRFDEEYWLDLDDEVSNLLELVVRPL